MFYFQKVNGMTATVASKLQSSPNASKDSHRSLVLAQKTELIGELAQAVSNQFNNIMMAVTGYAELELKKPNPKDRRALEQVLANATRATSLIQKLLDFSRSRISSPAALDLSNVASELSDLLKEVAGEQLDIVLRLDTNRQNIYADRVDVEQILLALVVTARNVISGGGQLSVSSSLVNLDQEFIGAENGVSPGDYAVLSVVCGEAPTAAGTANSASVGRNQDLNPCLVAVRAIMKDCHGLARFSIEPGTGSSYKVYFPVVRSEAVDQPASPLPRHPAVTRTILVVEDDDAVRVPAAEFLMMEGFKVLQARTGSEALNVVQQSRSSLDILIADIVMPKMNGHQVAAKLLEQHPDLKVLYMSGDPSRSGPSPANKMPQNATLRKPFRLNTLRDKIHDLLGE
jgi:two-component system, cell cycle sensor histidine kinase and response regulator CckA